MPRLRLTSSGALLLCVTVCFAQTVEQLSARKALARIAGFDRGLDGVLGVAAIDLTSGETIEYQANTQFPTASLIKVPVFARVMQAVRAGELRFDQRVTVHLWDAVGGSGHLQAQLANGPVTLTLDELLRRMIVDSDNTAANQVIALAGRDKVNAAMAALGLPGIRLQRVMMDTKAAKADAENIATPAEMAKLMAMFWRGEAFPAEDCNKIIEVMKGVRGAFREVVPASVAVASKTGDLTGVYSEGGLVLLNRRPYAYAVMSSLLPDEKNPIPAVARILQEHFERLSHGNRYGNQVH